MAKVVPFRGFKYNANVIKDLNDVTAPPYDIVSEEEQKRLCEKNEYNITNIDNGLSYDNDTESENRYTRSGAYLKDWINKQILTKEEEPAFYVYEQIFSLNDGKPAHSLKGIISLVELAEFSENKILPHEETISKAKDDRIKLMRATDANTSAVYALYPDDEETIARLIEANSEGKPDISFCNSENIIQNIWTITDKEVLNKITRLFEDKKLYIADGHHRYETALNYRKERHNADGSEIGTKDYDYIMMMLVSMTNSGLFVFPTHRVVKGIERFDETMLVGFLTEEFSASKIHFTEGDFAAIISDKLASALDDKLFALYTGGNYYYLLKLKNFDATDSVLSDKSQAYRRLDVNVLHKLILEKYLGIDAENMKEQKNLAYMREATDAVKAVKDGEYQCAFLINPTKVSEIRDIASVNEKMPQKSTYFWPKLTTGLVINKFDD